MSNFQVTPDHQAEDQEHKPLNKTGSEPMEIESQPKVQDVQFDEANLLQRLLCLWLIPYYKNSIEWFSDIKNMFHLPKLMNTDQKILILEKHWDEELKKPEPKFWKALLRTYFMDLASITIPKLIDTSLMLVLSLIIGRMLEIINGEGEDWEGYCLVLALFCTQMYIATSHNYQFLKGFMIAGAMRAATLKMLYNKTLGLQQALTAGSTATGKLVAVAATDTELFDFFLLSIFLPIGPFVFLLSVIVMYFVFGEAGLIGSGLVLFMMICMYILGYQQYKLRLSVGMGTDQKLKILNSIIEGIRVIKMYAWEFAYEKIIQQKRYTEVKNEAKTSSLMAVHFGTFLCGFGPVLFVTFYSYIKFGNELTPAKAFTGVSLIFVVIQICVGVGCAGANFLMLLGGACNRIGNVMKLGKRDPNYCIRSSDTGVKLEDFSASWKLQEEDPSQKEDHELKLRRQRTSVDMTYDTLANLNLEVNKGELAAVVGPVGAGKSSLISAILGEMYITKGNLTLNGNFAYVEQEPWIRSASVRENIIMDKAYDATRYEEVINVCSLRHDFETLTNGDSTMIGDRGVNLSGGQKARIALARAVYSDADIYLLDDPLSAVDVQVRVDLFEKCISQYLSNKTRILVTHQLHVIDKVEKIICLDKGCVVANGNYSELQNNEDFIEVMGKISEQNKQEQEKETKKKQEEPKSPTKIKEVDKQTILAEEHALGSVPFGVYFNYWKTGGCGWFAALMVFFASVQVLYL